MTRTWRYLALASVATLMTVCFPAASSAQFGTLTNQGSTAGGNNSLSGSSLASSITSMTQNRGMDAQSLRNFGGGDAFRSAIGADMLGQTMSMNAMGRNMMGMGMMGRMGGFGNQFGMMNQQQSNQRGKANLRIPMRIGFRVPVAQMAARSQQFATRVPKIPGFAQVRGLSVEMDGETAILRGTVESEEQRELMERMAKLEPGISAVRNELLVAAAESAPPGELPPPAENR
jgi:hypothetical protein